MSLKSLKLVSAKNKRNILSIAIGSYQSEYFELDGVNYFCVYRQDGDQFRSMCINLEVAKIIAVESGFRMVDGSRLYKLFINDKSNSEKVKITEYLWGWLPYQSISGKVSKSGLVALKNGINSRVINCENT